MRFQLLTLAENYVKKLQKVKKPYPVGKVFWKPGATPRRIELVTSFYKHPVEITINSLLTSAIVYPLPCGVSPQG